MFTAIKGYINIIIGVAVTAFLGYVEYLRVANKSKEADITRLKKDSQEQAEVAKDNVKQASFKAKQEVRKDKLKESEVFLDDLEKRGKNDKVPTSTNDDFVSVSV